MVIILLVVLLVSSLFLWTLRFASKKFNKLELFILSLFASFLCQHINFKVFSAYERLHVKAELIPRIISYLHFGIIVPALLIWVLYFFRSSFSLMKRILFSISWIGYDLLAKSFYLEFNILITETKTWYPIVDVFISVIILIISIIFLGKWRAILRSERVIH